MWIQTFFKSLISTPTRRRPIRRGPVAGRLCVEPLEDRCLPSNYIFIDLGTLGGTDSDAVDLNASGQVVGMSTTAAGDTHAFLWNNSVMIDLGTLGGRSSRVQAINDRGQIVGWASRPDTGFLPFLINPEDADGNGSPDRWFRDFNGDGANDLMVELPLYSVDINNSGQVVGSDSGGARLWTPTTPNGTTGTLTDLPLYPFGINDAGQVIGWALIADTQHAVLWQNGVMTDLGAGRANAINASGQIIGVSVLYAAGFVWTPTTPNGTVGTFTGLGDPSGGYGGIESRSEPFGLNNSGQVVGYMTWSSVAGDGGGGSGDSAFLWNPALDHPQLPGVLESAVAINDAGQIVGHTYGADFWIAVPSSPPWHAGLLTPIPDVPLIVIGDGTITEGNTGTRAASFTVTLSAASSQTVTVAYGTANETATADSDYQAVSGTLTFAPGETSKTVNVLVNGDRLPESRETFLVNLTQPTNAWVADPNGVGIILDDEPFIGFDWYSDFDWYSGAEGNTGTTAFTFTVTLSAVYDAPVTVDYNTADPTPDQQYGNGWLAATAGVDYTAASGTLTIPAGQVNGTITVLVTGDRVVESDELFNVNLSNPSSAHLGYNQTFGYIVDDEPRVSIGAATALEGNTGTKAFLFTVTLSAASDAPVTVSFATANGTATAGSDYQAASSTLTIPAGQTTGTITVLVNGDRLGEYDESFYVNLTGATGALIGISQGYGTIQDDEPRISISDVSKKEGRRGQTTLFTFTVTLSAAYDQAVTMSYATANGTAKTSDNDYIAKTGTLSFAPGETSKTITIVVNGDSKKETDETFFLDLFGNSSNSVFTKSRGIGTILNDD